MSFEHRNEDSMYRDWSADKQHVISTVAPYSGLGGDSRPAGGLSFGSVTPNELSEWPQTRCSSGIGTSVFTLFQLQQDVAPCLFPAASRHAAYTPSDAAGLPACPCVAQLCLPAAPSSDQRSRPMLLLSSSSTKQQQPSNRSTLSALWVQPARSTKTRARKHP